MNCACVWLRAKRIVLASRSPPFDCVAMLHQVLEYLVHRVLVEEPAVDGGGVDLGR